MTIRYIKVFLIALVLIAGPIVRPAMAEGPDRDIDKPIRLFATATTGPIGALESYGKMTVDGRAVYGERLVWGGEMLRANNSTVQVRLDHVGQVLLTRGAIVKLATAFDNLKDGASGSLLVAQLIAGDMTVKLNEGAGAYIEASGAIFNASSGASFCLGVREGEPLLDTLKGEVAVQDQTAQRKYIIRPVRLGATTSVKARESRQIQVRVTDENDNPVPDVPVVFLLGSQDVGGLGAGATTTTVTTNAQGIATASFSAGAVTGTTSITATVAGTTAVWTGTIAVTAATTAILSGTVIAVIAAAAAAGVTTAVVVAKSGDEQVPDDRIVADPPIIRPGGR